MLCCCCNAVFLLSRARSPLLTAFGNINHRRPFIRERVPPVVPPYLHTCKYIRFDKLTIGTGPRHCCLLRRRCIYWIDLSSDLKKSLVTYRGAQTLGDPGCMRKPAQDRFGFSSFKHNWRQRYEAITSCSSVLFTLDCRMDMPGLTKSW